MSDPAEGDAQSAVWASVAVPAPPAEVLAACRDFAGLLRLNPHLEIRAWEETPGPLAPGKTYRVQALNEWTGIERRLEFTVLESDAGGYRLAAAPGFRHALEVRVAPHAGGTALTLKDHYRRAAAGEEAALQREIDRSLTPWALAVSRDIRRSRRWGRHGLYRRLRAFWLGMRPRERRIGRMLVWVGVLEFVVFLFVFAIYWNEAGR